MINKPVKLSLYDNENEYITTYSCKQFIIDIGVKVWDKLTFQTTTIKDIIIKQKDHTKLKDADVTIYVNNNHLGGVRTIHEIACLGELNDKNN